MPGTFDVITTLIDLIGELILTCATLTLVILIYRQVSLNQQHNKVLIRPIVAVEKYPHRSKLVLSFKNYGTGTAMDVQGGIAVETDRREDIRLTNVGVIRPNENRNETFENANPDIDRPFKVVLSYTDIEKNLYQDEFTIQP